MADVYERFANYLDWLPASFPRTESGVELKILRKLFSPEEAELALHLNLVGDEGRVVAFRVHRPVEAVVAALDSMAQRGLISRSQHPGKPATYAVSQFVVGFYEGQVDKLDRELVDLFEEYFPELATRGSWTKLPQLRTVPVGESIPVTTEVLPYEQADAILRASSAIAVQNCVCRQEQEIHGHRCHNDMESCMVLGGAAESMIAAGTARKLTLEEALRLIHRAEEQGRVLQPANAQNPIFLCTCCSCCCGVLRMLKMQEKPAIYASNPFVAQLNEETCAGCGTCVDRCPMDALTLPNGTAEHDPDRCIGCGLCVSTCPTESLSMVRRPEGSLPIPKNVAETYMRLGQMRDKLFVAKMAGVLAKSAVERIIAPR